MPPDVLAGGSKSCDTRAVSGLFLVMPTTGEYRVVEAAVQNCRARVQLRRCGVGPGRAAAMCAEFEREARPQAVALLGWAGGLLDHLAVGDIVIADQALSATDSGVDCLRLELPGLPRVHCGPMLTTGHVLATPEAKRSAGKSGALAVEMEAYPLAAWAAKHKVPFVHGRVILDTVDEALPELDRVLDGYGQVQIRPLLGALRSAAGLAGRVRSLRAPLTQGQPTPRRAGSGCCRGTERPRPRSIRPASSLVLRF